VEINLNGKEYDFVYKETHNGLQRYKVDVKIKNDWQYDRYVFGNNFENAVENFKAQLFINAMQEPEDLTVEPAKLTKEYTVVSGGYKEFVENINSFLANGWEPCGGVSQISIDRQGLVPIFPVQYAQALIRNNDVKEI
jgi:FKBP-type peptidyl-prolyl cis-trans isomerase (trigger factor)